MTSLTLAQQGLLIREKFKSVKIKFNKAYLTVKMELKPSGFSPIYPITIEYHKKENIKVWVGNLKRLDDPKFPHNYGKNEEKKSALVCLYHPKKGEWNTNESIAETIVPWISEWLFYYELWLATGKWLGGGEHPTVYNEI